MPPSLVPRSAHLAAYAALLLTVGVRPLAGAELFTLGHQPFSRDYASPSGPLVLSGEIVPGDYDRLLARIAENPSVFLAQNRLIVAGVEGDPAEAIRIGELLRAMLTEVTVGPATGPCSGPCFLIYLAAARRGSDGQGLLGMYAPPSDEAGLKRLTDYLSEKQLPSDLLERLLVHTQDDPYWLSEAEEEVLGTRSAAFEQMLIRRCGWSPELEHAVYQRDRPIDDLKRVSACRDRIVQPAARHALCLALAERDRANQPPAAQSSTQKKRPRAAKKSECIDPKP